ncbi:MAG: VOC family protein, partial [Sciscionella sp.]
MSTDHYAEVSYYGGLADGTPCWLEIATPDADATKRFYGSIFGWEFEESADTAGSPYTVATLFGEPVCGIVAAAGPILDWTLYLVTSDLDWAQNEAVRFGGAIIGGTQQLPGVGTKMLFDDAGGSTVGLCQPAADWSFIAGLPGTLVWAELITR